MHGIWENGKNYNKQQASHADICNYVFLDALCYAQYVHHSVFTYGFIGNDYLLENIWLKLKIIAIHSEKSIFYTTVEQMYNFVLHYFTLV